MRGSGCPCSAQSTGEGARQQSLHAQKKGEPGCPCCRYAARVTCTARRRVGVLHIHAARGSQAVCMVHVAGRGQLPTWCSGKPGCMAHAACSSWVPISGTALI